MDSKLLFFIEHSKQTFICSKTTIETPEKRVKICSKLTIKTPERRH